MKISSVLMLCLTALAGVARGEDAYIESTGTQAINTGYCVNAKTRIEADFQVTTVTDQARLWGIDGTKGSVYRANLRDPQKAFRCLDTFGDADGFVDCHPRFTFFGYRYAEISATGPVEIESVTSVPVTSIAKEMEIGSLETGDRRRADKSHLRRLPVGEAGGGREADAGQG